VFTSIVVCGIIKSVHINVCVLGGVYHEKVLSVFVAIAIVAALSLTAFAYTPSPVSVGEFKVRVDSYATGELGPVVIRLMRTEQLRLRGRPKATTTLGWKIYGEYEIVSGTLNRILLPFARCLTFVSLRCMIARLPVRKMMTRFRHRQVIT
jgi:hypothetical protein